MNALLAVMVVVVLALHQDFWFWTDKTLVFGFLPIGLFYHGCYAILASLTIAVLVKYAWPAHLEEIETENRGPDGEAS